MVSKFQTEMASATPRNTRSKTALQKQKRKDPNTRVFMDTSGRVFKTLHLDWSRIYSIFDHDDFLIIPHDQPSYERIPSSQRHLIA